MKGSRRYWRSNVAEVGVVLLLLTGVVGATVLSALGAPAGSAGYVLQTIAFLGDPAPGPQGASFAVDFEPMGINNRGELAFAADMSTGVEGVFLARKGQISQITAAGQAAPGGGTFDVGVFGHTAINAQGDVAFAFFLSPFGTPVGVNAGVYRYSHSTRKLTAVMVPEVTPAPGGGVFKGVFFHAGLNDRGDVVFGGIIPTDKGVHTNEPGQEDLGLGVGVFRADRRGRISSVVIPGDPAPGGGTFDYAANPWINSRGDIAFGGHLAGEECIGAGSFSCFESVYLKKAATGEIRSIAHQGDPAPGGGTYRIAWGPVLNDRGEILFIGNLGPPPDVGPGVVFLYSRGTTLPMARPGDPMPGGGNFRTASFFIANYSLNNRGEVAFHAGLDTDVDSDGRNDEGLYVWSRGSLRLVARTGTVIPGVGTIAQLQSPAFGYLDCRVSMNDHGDVFFQATLTDGRGVLLVARPRRGR